MGLGSFLFGSSGTNAQNVLQPAVGQAGQYTNQFGGAANGANDAMATGSTTGSQYATQQVMNNPMLSGLFGQGGQLSKSEDLSDQLNSTGYNLTSQDQDALGQASGNIARTSAAQDQGLASSLAARGFGGAGSGVAGAAFSNSAGNKFEQLAQAQTQIAQQRVQNTQNRINANNQLMTTLGGEAANDEQQQYGRQLSGAQFGAQQNQQGVDNAAANQNEINEQFAQQQQTKSSGALGALGGAALTAAGAAFGGPIGAGLGSSLGKSLFGGGGSSGGGGGFDFMRDANPANQ